MKKNIHLKKRGVELARGRKFRRDRELSRAKEGLN